jgi:signal transduction histidine kinase
VPFFTTKAGGSGIGLVLSRQIAEAHSGSLDVENRDDGPGCRAKLTLPVGRPDRPTPAGTHLNPPRLRRTRFQQRT